MKWLVVLSNGTVDVIKKVKFDRILDQKKLNLTGYLIRKGWIWPDTWSEKVESDRILDQKRLNLTGYLIRKGWIWLDTWSEKVEPDRILDQKKVEIELNSESDMNSIVFWSKIHNFINYFFIIK